MQDIFHEGLGQACSNREAMQDLSVKRTLVKSPPELWSELSEVERLARHLDAFGEIKITRLEPERTVAWEGEGASGTVSIEPSGWGTKVVLTARIEGEEPPPEPEPKPEPEPAAAVPAVLEPPQRKRRWLGRWFGRDQRRPMTEQPVWVSGEVAAVEEPVVEAPPAPEEPVDPPAPADDGTLSRDGVQAALEGALEALGSAHHRPFSRG
jgi:hypothetical protein